MMQYKSYSDIAEILDCSPRTVTRIVNEMIDSGRYPAKTFLLRLRRVELNAVLDYCGREKK